MVTHGTDQTRRWYRAHLWNNGMADSIITVVLVTYDGRCDLIWYRNTKYLEPSFSRLQRGAGSAGALFGLAYYLLLSIGLGLAGAMQSLGLVLTLCGVAATICAFLLHTRNR